MIVFPHCKINLGLHIVAKREDGYHNLETVFYPVPLYDALELVETSDNLDEISIIMDGLNIDGDTKNNLIYKAYKLISADYKLPHVTFCLYKNIPMGAGLGGGSSDGAFAIRLLNEYFKLDIPFEKQLDYASKLGSDCAYFLYNKACLAHGRGELLTEINFSLKGKWIVLIKPPIHVSTADAFAGIKPRNTQENSSSENLLTILSEPIKNWKNKLTNDFEASIFAKHRILKEIKETLYEHGAEYVAMSGSGATIFGLFDGNPPLENVFTNVFFYAVQLN